MEERTVTGSRDGFTLMEVLIAMVILAIALMGIQAAMSDLLIRDVGVEQKRAIAQELAAERIRAVTMDEAYATLETRYETVENPVAGFTGYKRTTEVARTQSAGADYKTVSVKVERAGLATPVVRTTVVGAP
jgi:prepilin-type N-terminal cleavage/methylation domain-containing protein